MKIIQKIKIKKFRSIKQEEIILDDITIFSGRNNSGKSNILRALNLFFNGESNFGQKYTHERDYNLAYTANARGKREIEIALYFKGQGNGALSRDFHIVRRFGKNLEGSYEYYSDDEKIQQEIDKKNGNILREFTGFLNKLVYYYVPAVRDKSFVKNLFLLFERLLESDEEGFRKKITELSDILKTKSENISKDFKSFLKIPAHASLSTSIADVLSAIVINVQSGIKIEKKSGEGRIHPQTVDLFSSGDGVLMSYIPHFLAYIANSMSRKYFIWGFEEPENSLEYSKAQEIADKFQKDFNKSSQILITTHSPAFIKLKNKTDVKFYRIYIDPHDPTQESKIRTIEQLERDLSKLPEPTKTKQYELLEQELGFVEMSNDIEDYLKKWKEEKEQQEKKIEEIQKKYKESVPPEKVFICEDGDPKTIQLWEKLLLEILEISELKIVSSGGCDNDEWEIFFKKSTQEQKGYHPKIFRQFDRDGYTQNQINIIEEEKNKKYGCFFCYKLKFLPVHEMENFALLNEKEKFQEIIEENETEIVEKFNATIEGKLLQAFKFFKGKKEEFANKESNKTQMRQEMRQDKIRFLNGKEIAKLKPNFSPIKVLEDMNPEQYPQELKDYLQGVRDFFNK